VFLAAKRAGGQVRRRACSVGPLRLARGSALMSSGGQLRMSPDSKEAPGQSPASRLLKRSVWAVVWNRSAANGSGDKAPTGVSITPVCWGAVLVAFQQSRTLAGVRNAVATRAGR
jgi:hypothetical protein